MTLTTRCKHPLAKDFTTQLNWGSSSEPVQHFYCPDCGWHNFRGVEYTKQEWFDWINDGEEDRREVQIPGSRKIRRY